MADYWKSLPKKYCDFCKCWITDNKSSRDFHERGLRHQANVRRRVKEIQKNNTIQEKERQQFYNEMLKIENAALNSFKNDIQRDPKLASEYSTIKSLVSPIRETNFEKNKKPIATNRFGEDVDTYGESSTLVNGKKRALETISKSFEKKCKWLEGKTADGKSYYWNRDTLDTRYDPPKSGFLSIAEQQQQKIIRSSNQGDPDAQSSSTVYRPDPYGGWKNVEKYDTTKMVDLQLPDQDIGQIVFDIEKAKQDENNESEKPQSNRIEFKEKTVDTLQKPLFGKQKTEETISFKKRTKNPRNIRNNLANDDQ